MTEKRHEISEFDRGRCVGAHDGGMSIRRIADLYNIPKTTVHRIIYEFEEHGVIKAQPRSGRPHKLDDWDKCHLVQLVEKNHFAPLAQITAEVQDITGKSISMSTVQRALHIEGYVGMKNRIRSCNNPWVISSCKHRILSIAPTWFRGHWGLHTGDILMRHCILATRNHDDWCCSFSSTSSWP